MDKSAHNLLWVTDFPMFEWNEDEERLEALHHPFTAPKQEDVAGGITIESLKTARAQVIDAMPEHCPAMKNGRVVTKEFQECDSLPCNLQAYDMVYNGVEIGGGSLRIYRCV